MATLLDIRNEVIQKLQENSTPEYWSVDELNTYINNSLKDLNRDVRILKKFQELTPVSSGFYSLPDDVIEVIGVYYNGEPLTQTTVEDLDYSFVKHRHLQQFADEEFYKFPSWREAKGDPKFWLVYDNKIRVVPYQDVVTSATSDVTIGGDYGFYMSGDGVNWGFYFPSGATYNDTSGFGGIYSYTKEGGVVITAYPSVYIDYVYIPVDLLSDTDVVNLPDTLNKALVYKTLFECFSREGDTEDQRKAFNYYQLYEDEITRYKNANMPEIQPRYIERFI